MQEMGQGHPLWPKCGRQAGDSGQESPRCSLAQLCRVQARLGSLCLDVGKPWELSEQGYTKILQCFGECHLLGLGLRPGGGNPAGVQTRQGGAQLRSW